MNIKQSLIMKYILIMIVAVLIIPVSFFGGHGLSQFLLCVFKDY